MRYQGRLTGYVWVSCLLLLILPLFSVASETRFYHFYFSQEYGVPVYLTGLLSTTALHSIQQQVPGFQSRRAQLNDHERLLLVSSPDSGHQDILFRPTGIRLYPAGMSSGISKAMPCSLLSPLEIYFSDFSTNPATPYQLWHLPGPVNTRCSHFHYSGTSQVSYFRDLPLAASDALPFPDGTTIIEVPAVEKNTQGPAISGAGGFGLQQLLGAGGFGSWFDFRPGGGGGGGGYSNLLDISIMPALMAAAENNSDAKTSDSEEMIVINIIDSANREWQQAYTKDEAQKLLADIDDGDELISRIQKLQIAVSAEITGDLSSVCREGVQRLSQVLALTHERHGQAIPGVIHLDGGKKDASTQTSPESAQQGSANSGQATSHPRGTTKGGTSGAAGDGNDEEEGSPEKLKSTCEASDCDQAAAAEKDSYFYSFKYLDKEYDLKVQPIDENINYLVCAICLNLCHQASTLCGKHFDCNQCLQEKLNQSAWEILTCARCRENQGSGIVHIAAMDIHQINPLAVSCPGQEDGCTETPRIKDLESHCSTCPCIEVKCPNDLCRARVLRGKLPDHKDECEYQVIPCTNKPNGCSVEIIRKRMPQHLASCKYEMVNCPTLECPEMICRHSVEAHQGVCAFVIVACDNAFKDELCQAQCRRGELELHKQKECLYQIIPCPDCQKNFARLALSQHSQICEYRPVQCTFCNQSMAWRQLLRHQITHLRETHSQNQENAFSQFSDICAEAAERQDQLFEWIKRQEEQQKSDAEKIEQLSKQCEISKESIASLRTDLSGIHHKLKKLESTKARPELIIKFPGFQLRGFVGDKVVRAFKDEKEINHNYRYCIIPKKELDSMRDRADYPRMVIKLDVSDVHIFLEIKRRCIHWHDVDLRARIKLTPNKDFPSCSDPASRTVYLQLLNQKGRAYCLRTYQLRPCLEVHDHANSSFNWSPSTTLIFFSNGVNGANGENYVHNGYLILLLKLED